MYNLQSASLIPAKFNKGGNMKKIIITLAVLPLILLSACWYPINDSRNYIARDQDTTVYYYDTDPYYEEPGHVLIVEPFPDPIIRNPVRSVEKEPKTKTRTGTTDVRTGDTSTNDGYQNSQRDSKDRTVQTGAERSNTNSQPTNSNNDKPNQPTRNNNNNTSGSRNNNGERGR